MPDNQQKLDALKEHLKTEKRGVGILLDGIQQDVTENPTSQYNFHNLLGVRAALIATAHEDDENLVRTQKLIDICIEGKLPDETNPS